MEFAFIDRMGLLIAVLAAAVALMTFGLYACLAASLWHFNPPDDEPPGPVLPMTLIKPVRGLDDDMAESFESIVEADPGRALQVLIALESEADPAYPVLKAFACKHRDRDIELVLAGPSRGRMGKIHNMIAALPRAKHPRVIFSDADTRATEGLLAGTSRAFERGYDAVFGLPYHVPVPGLGGWMFKIAFNHNFCLPAALSYHLGFFRSCAGAWMAYTKDILERVGGLEQFEHAIADDFAISDKATRLGARKCLLRELVPVQETGTSLREAFAHLVKWCSIIRWSLPAVYCAVPFLNLGVLSCALWLLCELSGRHAALGRGLLAAALASRVLVGFLQDRLAARVRLPWWEYLSLVFVDLGALVFWPFGFRSRILWRGIRYRLHAGGRAEVLS